MHMDMWEVDDELPYLYSEDLKDRKSRQRSEGSEHGPLIIRFKDLTFKELPQYKKIL